MSAGTIQGREGAADLNDAANPLKVLGANLGKFAEPVEDASEGTETFWLFSQNRHQHDLGMIDPTAAEITVTVAGKDFTLKQSPGLLTSSRSGGTTGAAAWRTTYLLAGWFATSENTFFQSGLLDENSTVLELGAGVAGLLPAILGPRIKHYLATDQPYALKLLQENIDSNNIPTKRVPKLSTKLGSGISLATLDWEQDDLSYFLSSQGLSDGVDMVIASDCVYNYHLIRPLVETCAGVCRARTSESKPTICMIAQQLREPDVFDDWLLAFDRHFHTWRLSDSTLGTKLDVAAGYVVHVGILRDGPT